MGSKYGNQKCHYKGKKFDSKLEMHRYVYLESLLNKGVITSLETQVKYAFKINSIKVCTYIADFRYTFPDGAEVVEDIKGVETAVFRIKKKLMKACHGIDVKVTKKATELIS